MCCGTQYSSEKSKEEFDVKNLPMERFQRKELLWILNLQLSAESSRVIPTAGVKNTETASHKCCHLPLTWPGRSEAILDMTVEPSGGVQATCVVRRRLFTKSNQNKPVC